MFSGLDAYKQADYFQAHKQGVLITEKKKKYTIHFVACLVTESDSFAYNIAFPTDKEKDGLSGAGRRTGAGFK